MSKTPRTDAAAFSLPAADIPGGEINIVRCVRAEEMEKLELELAAAIAFHRLAVKERDAERALVDAIRAALGTDETGFNLVAVAVGVAGAAKYARDHRTWGTP